MNDINFKHSIIFFNLCILISPFYLMLNQEPIILCLFTILIIGISHGSLDNNKGRIILEKKFPKKWSFVFYGAYLLTSVFVLVAWIYSPLISLCIFFLIASFHFGYEDLEMFFNQNFILQILLYFLRGLIVISAPLYLNNIETTNFINILLLGEKWINLESATYGYIFYFNLISILSLTFLFWVRKNINLKDFFIIMTEVFSIVIIFQYLPLILAFTMYFCFMHSTKHILSLAIELNSYNVYAGIKSFAKKAAPLTIITFVMSLIMLFYLSKEFSVDKSILKVIFIGLAALTLPHIMLEYIYGKYK